MINEEKLKANNPKKKKWAENNDSESDTDRLFCPKLFKEINEYNTIIEEH